MKVGSLFSGIGGIDLGLERAGMTIAWQVEKDAWCRKILTKHWPEVPKYDDVQTLQPEALEPVDLLAGGFPCQDLSVAGKRAGIIEGARSGLWGEFARLVRAIRPQYLFVENVAGLLIQPGLGVVLGDLAECGYDAEWQVLSAAAFGAPHARRRIWIVAYPYGKPSAFCVFPRHSRQTTKWHIKKKEWGEDWFKSEVGATATVCIQDQHVSESRLVGVSDGIPLLLDRIRGLGNAVVPQIVEWIGRQIVRPSRKG